MPGRVNAITPPHDIPDGKKSIDTPAGRSAHRDASNVFRATSLGSRTARPVTPERIERVAVSIRVATWICRRSAALRSAFSSAAISTA